MTQGAFQSAYGGGATDSFVFKLDPAGNTVFSTYLGSPDNDSAGALLQNRDGRIYVVVNSIYLA